MTSIFIFRRDYRLTDNIGFIECYKQSQQIIPIFIFTPEQVENNEYFSSNCFQFLLESLKELNEEFAKNNGQIHYFYGNNIEILNQILENIEFDSIFFNMDYTLYAKKRDLEIQEFCLTNNKKYQPIEDYLLLPMGSYLKKDGKPYEVYTPFKNNAKLKKVELPNNFKFTDLKSKLVSTPFDFSITIDYLDSYYTINENILLHGGRINALKILKKIDDFENYADVRNTLILPTTHLSAYIKFGCVSIREVYNAIFKKFGIEHGLIEQLYWREYYYYLGNYFPHVLEGKSLREKYEIEWNNDPILIEAWKNGLTGFPGVDASMRELNETGYMHNRGRLIVSDFFMKILKCDWRIAEKYFATHLIDYDPLVNNGNWQWINNQPSFRIMSPWKQIIRFDKDCVYIKKWIPELRNVNPKDILSWDKSTVKTNYPKPIVDYDIMRKKK